jgi:hypothetical protein
MEATVFNAYSVHHLTERSRCPLRRLAEIPRAEARGSGGPVCNRPIDGLVIETQGGAWHGANNVPLVRAFPCLLQSPPCLPVGDTSISQRVRSCRLG